MAIEDESGFTSPPKQSDGYEQPNMEKTDPGYTLPLRRSEIYEDIPDSVTEKGCESDCVRPQTQLGEYEEVSG